MEAGRSELEAVLRRAVVWAETNPDIRALALVGSYARGTARANSDIDLIVLTLNPTKYTTDDGWISELGLGDLVQTKPWGAITERRLRRRDGVEIEVGIGEPTWASVDPVDHGTQRVVTDGIRSLYDPDGLLQRLIQVCA